MTSSDSEFAAYKETTIFLTRHIDIVADHESIMNTQKSRSEGDNVTLLEVDAAQLPHGVGLMLEDARIALSRSPDGNLGVHGEIIPDGVIDEEHLLKIFHRLQQRALEEYGATRVITSDGIDSLHIAFGYQKVIEARPMGGETPHQLAIGIRTLIDEDIPLSVQEQLSRVSSISAGDVELIEMLRVWGLALESVVHPLEPSERYALNVQTKSISRHNVFFQRLNTLMERGIRADPETLQADLVRAEQRDVEHKRQKLDRAFDTIGGNHDAKRRLQEMSAAMLSPMGAEFYGIQAPHFFLYGPPGTGKTKLLQAFAGGIDAQTYVISPTGTNSAYYGESERNVQKRIDEAIELYRTNDETPLLIIIDEIDRLIMRRSDPHGHYHNIIRTLDTALDDLLEKYPNRIIVAGTMNLTPDDLDASVTRSGRLEAISVPLPSQEERFDIWGVVLRDSVPVSTLHEFYAPDIRIETLAQVSDGLTGADFTAVVARLKQEKFVVFQRTGEHSPITQADLERGISLVRGRL